MLPAIEEEMNRCPATLRVLGKEDVEIDFKVVLNNVTKMLGQLNDTISSANTYAKMTISSIHTSIELSNNMIQDYDIASADGWKDTKETISNFQTVIFVLENVSSFFPENKIHLICEAIRDGLAGGMVYAEQPKGDKAKHNRDMLNTLQFIGSRLFALSESQAADSNTFYQFLNDGTEQNDGKDTDTPEKLMLGIIDTLRECIHQS